MEKAVIAVDANVLVRLFTRDNPALYAAAEALVAEGEVSVSATVLLETEWVLRSLYGCAKPEVLRALSEFVAMPGMNATEPEALGKAIAWARSGMDFADALHLALAEKAEAFATFDRNFAKRAARVKASPSVRLMAPRV